MHYTLHITNRCNLACTYCYVHKGTADMSLDTAKQAVDLAAKDGGHHGIVFFGGEPLLCRELMEQVVDYAEAQMRDGGVFFHFKVTTNGLSMDESFLNWADRHEVFIALSHDGQGNHCRIAPDGTNISDAIDDAARRLLSRRPYAPVLMTVTPHTLSRYADNVKYLFDLGFRYLICTMDYSAPWQDKDLLALKRQYRRLAALYREWTKKEEKFYLSPFEVKIASHIRSHDLRAERCELGKKQLSIAPDGKIYPCVQLVGDPAFCIGDVTRGIDEEKRQALYLLNEREKPECAGCVIRDRCQHTCACLNKSATGDIMHVSPFLCAHERILLPIADGLAERLYGEENALFIQKQYNDMFPLLSLTEDKVLRK